MQQVRDMACNAVKNVLLCTKATDVVSMATSFFCVLQSLGLTQLWILYGSGRNQTYRPIHQIAGNMGEETFNAHRVSTHLLTATQSRLLVASVNTLPGRRRRLLRK